MLDGRETTPLAARPKRFVDETGQPLKFFDTGVGGAVGRNAGHCAAFGRCASALATGKLGGSVR
jgi:hypothetical protein